jgi:geranylgeranyl pyrophosphate synthase
MAIAPNLGEIPKNHAEKFNERFLSHFRAQFPSSTILIQAIEYSMQAPGKRLRPRFVEESARQVSLDSRATELCAFALEMVHLFSLVHDDLPCLDNDDFRRGILTTHKKFSEAQALLAGDALLSMALETFAQAGEFVATENFLAAFQFFSKCIGAEGMIGGQSLELELTSPSLDELLKIQALKTTELFKAALLCPLLLSGAKKNEPLFLENLKYAEAFGFAFQIADDLEDAEQDALQQNKNILSQMGRQNAIDLALRQLNSLPISLQFSATELLVKKLS